MRKTFMLLCCAVIITNLHAQKNADNKIADHFDAYIKSAMQLWKTPGLSVTVVKDNQLVFKKAYGVTNTDTKAPFTTATVSICASTTKAMTAVCMGMLVDEGKVKWTDKLRDVYPELQLYDNYANSEITVQDLFTHNTGLGNADNLWAYNEPTDSVIYKMRYLQPAYSFRSSFIYQNLMYMVAGEVIHKVSGKPWDVFIKERLFQPLGMNHTYPNHTTAANEPSQITPHWMYDDSMIKPIPFIDYKAVGSAGAVWSCADDINKWMMFILDSARIGDKRLLQPDTYNMLFKPHSIVTEAQFYPTQKVTKPHWTTYGLGWFQEDYKGNMVNFHTGSLDGAVAIIGLIKEANFGVYIFANMDHTEIRHALMYKAMDLWVLHDDKDDWSKKLYDLYNNAGAERRKQQKDEEAKRVMNTKPSLDLKAYTGKYHNDIYGDAEVVIQGDSLTLKLPYNNNIKLIHWNYDTFSGIYEHDWNGRDYIPFHLTTDGKVSGFIAGGVTYTKDEEPVK